MGTYIIYLHIVFSNIFGLRFQQTHIQYTGIPEIIMRTPTEFSDKLHMLLAATNRFI